jgi:hypothetical protein
VDSIPGLSFKGESFVDCLGELVKTVLKLGAYLVPFVLQENHFVNIIILALD